MKNTMNVLASEESTFDFSKGKDAQSTDGPRQTSAYFKKVYCQRLQRWGSYNDESYFLTISNSFIIVNKWCFFAVVRVKLSVLVIYSSVTHSAIAAHFKNDSLDEIPKEKDPQGERASCPLSNHTLTQGQRTQISSGVRQVKLHPQS